MTKKFPEIRLRLEKGYGYLSLRSRIEAAKNDVAELLAHIEQLDSTTDSLLAALVAVSNREKARSAQP